MVLALFAAAAAFVAVVALAAWASGAFRSPVEVRLSRMAPGGTTGPAPEAPFSDRVFIPVLDGVVNFVVQLLPSTMVTRVRRQLLAAGSPMTPQAFFTMVVVSAILLPAAALFLVASLGDGVTTTAILISIVCVGVGAFLPFTWLRRKVRQRKLAVWKRLADAFDMVTVCVEAGLGLDAALRQMATKLKGPLADEIALTLRQIGMGRPRREALEDMAERVDVTELTTFVHAVIQAEQLGTSLGRVLRAQSVSLRVRRRQRAEETARKAPVKMVFPLVLFIMPSFFVITLGPMIVHLTNYLND
jgi:tight adherence protein C